jgi:hypothetical protein
MLEGHSVNTTISCVASADKNILLTASTDGEIIGWLRPTYDLYFRIKDKY